MASQKRTLLHNIIMKCHKRCSKIVYLGRGKGLKGCVFVSRSRLGCQVIASKDIDGIRVRIPGATRNFAVDGYKPKPH